MSIKKILLWILFIILSSFTALLLLGATIQIPNGFNSSYIIPLLLTAFLLFIDIKLWEKLRVGKLLTTKNPEIIQQKATSINNEPVTVENKQQIQQTNKETANNIDNYEYFSCPVFGTNYTEKAASSEESRL